MATDAEARRIVDAYCRAHEYTLVAREQAARVERIAELEAENERLRGDLTYTRIEVDNARRERDVALDALDGENSGLAEHLREQIAAIGGRH